MTDWILAVDWTRIADIATAVVVVALAVVERHRILPGFFSGLGEGHRRFLMLVAGGVLILKLISIRFDAVLNVNILFVTGGWVRKGLFQLVDRLLRKACDLAFLVDTEGDESPQISE